MLSILIAIFIVYSFSYRRDHIIVDDFHIPRVFLFLTAFRSVTDPVS
jgi:hypothetical protein